MKEAHQYKKPASANIKNVLSPVYNLTTFSDDEIVAEIRRRGWSGELSMTKVISV